MRKILFKAKRKDNGEWVEGGFFEEKSTGRCFIIEARWSGFGFNHFIEINQETICQYTGLKDKNGKKIWENDILDAGEKLMVSWHHFKASWVLSKKGWMYNHFFGEAVEPEDVEVVGNIFDNPELLEVE